MGLWSRCPPTSISRTSPGRRAEVPAPDEARRIAANRAKLPDLVVAVPTDGKSGLFGALGVAGREAVFNKTDAPAPYYRRVMRC